MLMTLLFIHSCRESCQAFGKCVCHITQAWASYPVEKCLFMQHRVGLLGHRIDKEGIHTDERKVQIIRDAHPPSS